jgi:hypothetical protein
MPEMNASEQEGIGSDKDDGKPGGAAERGDIRSLCKVDEAESLRP